MYSTLGPVPPTPPTPPTLPPRENRPSSSALVMLSFGQSLGIIHFTSTQPLTRVVKFLLCFRAERDSPPSRLDDAFPWAFFSPPFPLGRRVVVVFHGYSTSKRPLLPPSLFLSAPLGKREETNSPIVLHGGCYRRVFCTLKALRGRVVWRRKRATFWQFTIFAECLWRGVGRQREGGGELE